MNHHKSFGFSRPGTHRTNLVRGERRSLITGSTAPEARRTRSTNFHHDSSCKRMNSLSENFMFMIQDPFKTIKRVYYVESTLPFHQLC